MNAPTRTHGRSTGCPSLFPLEAATSRPQGRLIHARIQENRFRERERENTGRPARRFLYLSLPLSFSPYDESERRAVIEIHNAACVYV